MNKILLILSLSFMLAGEMEVDGDLNVSGDIQSPTIEELQAQIAALQQGADNKLESRFYTLPRIEFQRENFFYDLNIDEIVGEELDFALIKIVRVNDWYIDNNYAEVVLQASLVRYSGGVDWQTDFTYTRLENGGTISYNDGARNAFVVYDRRNQIRLDFETSNGWVDLVLMVTGPFSQNIRTQK